MKRARADRIFWDVGYWDKSRPRKPRWVSDKICTSRNDARSYSQDNARFDAPLTIRRFEGVYIDAGE